MGLGQVRPFCLHRHQPCTGLVPEFTDRSRPRNFVRRQSILWASLFTSLEAVTPRTVSTHCTFSTPVNALSHSSRFMHTHWRKRRFTH
jgi:hypothetical protein